MQAILIPHHVHVCFANGHYVFLDLRRDQYSALDREKSIAFKSLIETRSTLVSDCGTLVLGSDDSVAKQVYQELTENGLLTTSRELGKHPLPAEVTQPTALLLIEDLRQEITPTMGEAVNCFRAYLCASALLRWRSIEAIVGRVRKRKEHFRGINEFDFNKAEKLVACFNFLRPFYHRQYLCLFDSLALLEFLCQYELFPTWVYGVKVEPFAAHCWIQEGEFAFNEAIEVTRSYTPLLVA